METKISNKRLRELEIAEKKLQALEAGGVDNWEWYGEAIAPFVKDLEKEERINQLLEDLEVTFLEGAYEPSERGAGFSATDKARAEAMRVVDFFLEEYNKI